MGTVVFLAQVRQDDGSRGFRAYFGQELPGLVVRQVASTAGDAILQTVGVGSTKQLLLVVIGLDGNVFATSDVGDQFIGPRTEVGDDGGTLTVVARDEGHVVRTGMGDGNGQNGKVITDPYQIERSEVGGQRWQQVKFKRSSLIGEDLGVPPCLHNASAASMVAVVMGDEDAVNVLGREVKASEPFLQLCAAKALVDEDPNLGGFQQRRVAPAPGSKVGDGHRHANKYKRSREILEHTDRTRRYRVFWRTFARRQGVHV